MISHLEDYGEVFGSRTQQFVCPITLRELDPEQLIEGHILNDAFKKASRRTVVQAADVDRFYGTRVEGGLVRHLNSKDLTTADLVRQFTDFEVQFHDGTQANAFPAQNTSGKKANGRYPIIKLPVDKEEIAFCIRVAKDDPRLNFPIQLEGSMPIMPAQWTAGLLKAAFLTMFDMIGYRVIADPFGDTLRRTLATYFRENGSSAQAAKYFADFKNSTKIVGMGLTPTDLTQNYAALPFDTLKDRVVFLHYTRADMRVMFAATCVFKVNDATFTISIPQSLGNADVAQCWRCYQAMLSDERFSNQHVCRAVLEGHQWKVEEKPVSAHYVDLPEVMSNSLRMRVS